ncbi:MAG: exodeoxyribonuclease VII large subunit [Clostridia bacterium]|nr:exodeoxyribonuclease VII large subunit [Clostridia bacterium]
MENSKMILSVTQINEYIRALLAQDEVLSMICVRGEISNLTFHRSGHIYFTLKDEASVLKAVMFRSSAQRVKFALKEGMNVIVYGRISLYTPSGQYQLYAEDIQPDGIGALYIAYEQIKEKLQKEGLFDASRKKAIPKLPSTVGIITSPTGAAIHDMINVMGRRFPLTKLVLFPALVQGDTAYKSLIAGIEYFNRTKVADVIIIGRGGGSMEDLWAFNNVELAYAIAASEIPVISAVGHESDFTICDFVADLRAPTPSAAAELAVPNVLTVKNDLNKSILSVEKTLISKVENYRKHLKMLASSRVLASKEDLLDEYKMRINLVSDKLDATMRNILRDKKHTYGILCAKLNAISPLNTLSRGYAIVQADGGEAIASVTDMKIGERVNVSLSNGNFGAIVDEINENGGSENG